MMTDWVCQDGGHGRTFATFGFDTLTDEPISDADFSNCAVQANNPCASAAWSAGVDWYFVVLEEGIFMAQPGSKTGLLCAKKSWRLIEEFLAAPKRRRKL